jgi:hypothetical protein
MTDMKMFYVFYDIAKAPGVIEEYCMSVYTSSKHKARIIYGQSKPKNAIFRCVKVNIG